MPNYKVAIIGGGISGLACAHRLLELKEENRTDLEIFLFEGSTRLGGTIETEVRDGFVLEKGPDSFISEKPFAVLLSNRLGIDGQIIGTRNENRKSFVLRNGKLIPVPQGFYLIAPTDIKGFLGTPLFSFPGKIRMMLEPFISKRDGDADESVGSFIRRRLGKECLERVAQAMLAGIYTGDPDKLSLKCTIPKFLELENKYGSVIRGLMQERKKKKESLMGASGPRYSLFLSYKNGMEILTRAIIKRLSGISIRLNSKIKEITYDRLDSQWKIFLSSGEIRSMNAVILALPAYAAADILGKMEPDVSSKLKEIPYESVATLNLAYKKEGIRHALDGFGFVVPAIKKNPFVAVSFSSQKFENRAPSDFVLLRAFIGGAFGRDFWEMEDAELKNLVKAKLSEILGISNGPLFSVLSRYPKSMIQYPLGHLESIALIKDQMGKHSGLCCIGPAFGAVGIPDCIKEAEENAKNVFNKFFGKDKL